MVLLNRRIWRGYFLFMHFKNSLHSMLFTGVQFLSNTTHAVYFNQMKGKQKVHENSEVMFHVKVSVFS